MTEQDKRSQVSRRGFIASSAAVAAAAAVPAVAAQAYAAAGSGSGTAATRPNILLIVTDDQPKHTEWAQPKLTDWLVGNGVKFTNGHVTTPLCSPSRASVFSGKFAHKHGVRNNSASYQLDQAATVQRYLKQAGYRTGLFGKYLNAWNLADNPPHFEDFALLKPGYVDAQWNVNGNVQTITGYTTTIIKNRTLGFIEKAAQDDRPWFAYVTPYASHGPNTPEGKYAGTPVPDWDGRPSVPEADRSDKPPYIKNATATIEDGRRIRAAQLRTLRSVDDAVGAFREKLRETGQLDNTLVIYVGDNGFSWADHAWTGKSVPYRIAHEVPFYLSWPAAGLGAGTKDDRIVANIDIAPTLLQAAGVSDPVQRDGHSLLSTHSRDHLLVEFWKQGTGTGGPGTWATWVGKDKQYTEYYDLTTGPEGRVSGTGQVTFREYYNLTNDPFQLKNELFNATPTDEQRLGIPELARQLAADRVS